MPRHAKRPVLLLCLLASLSGCSSDPRPALDEDASLPSAGQRLLGNNDIQAIAYSGHRKVVRTVENTPSLEETKEDLRILAAMDIKLLRTYNTTIFPHSERILQAIRELKQEDPDFEMVVMLGAWIQCKNAYQEGVDHSAEDAEFNQREIEAAIKLADEHPDVVRIIAVGNEAMVTWQGHFVPAATILRWVEHLQEARSRGDMPAGTMITTSENWAALGGEESYRSEDLAELVARIDFLSLHTYAFRASLDNSHYGDDGTRAADEYIAGLFHAAIRKWTRESNLTCFYFEAFDEPWKSDGTAGSEGHFGLITVDGRAKYALWELVDAGAFAGLSRGGRPIEKTHDGVEADLLDDLTQPVHLKFQP
jgi:exo-beta-1,3-glucanase (GH17 family)